MLDYQQVINEKAELDEKRKELTEFIASKDYLGITRVSRTLIRNQQKAMQDYSFVLGARIEYFHKDD